MALIQKIEKPVRKEKLESVSGKLANPPHHMKVNSVVWDDEPLEAEPMEFHSWVEALFGVKPPITVASFHPARERSVFTSTLINGINWNFCEEILVNLEESDLDPDQMECLMTLIELVRVAALREKDLKKVRLSRRPKE
jgi:hypothetical protein